VAKSRVVTRDIASRPFRDEELFIFVRHRLELGKCEFDMLYFLRGPWVAKMGGNAEVYGFRPLKGMSRRLFLIIDF